MKHAALCITLGLALVGPLASQPLWSQASDIPSAAPTAPAGQTPEQRGRKLMDEMIEALGGQAWLDRHDMQATGHSASFFRGSPNGSIVDFDLWKQFPDGAHPEAERFGFLTDKSMIFPGKKMDVVQVWTTNEGYEVSYKGRITLPKDQVEDYLRRRTHSIENVVHVWLKMPDVMVIYEGTSMVERRMTDKVTVLTATNDAVTIELDATTHLPLKRTFEWRNTTFKDHDEDVEQYDDYHTIQGLPTAFTMTRYHNGDMSNQRFYIKVQYNTALSPDLFNPDNLLKKK
jgi:hypothetical protein